MSLTQDEIISMARKAGFLTKCFNGVDGDEIVVQHSIGSFVWIGDELERFAALVAAHEREACAKVCEQIKTDYSLEQDCFVYCSAAIRNLT